MNRKQLLLCSILMASLAVVAMAAPASSVFKNFVTVRNGRLMDGDREMRFISFNIPNLHSIEDYIPFDETNFWRLPDAFEIRDALESTHLMGGTVARIYTLSVRRKDDGADVPRYVLGPGQFNEEAFRSLDQLFATANEVGVRIIMPFVDNWSWIGGRAEYAGFRGKKADDFWTDPQVKEDFKKTVAYTLQRVNTVTGVRYCDDRAILAWETGNELSSPDFWVREMAQYIKSIDHNHLVLDGYTGRGLRDESLINPYTDLVTTHHYERNPGEMVEIIHDSAVKARGKKAYLVGEFGFISTAGIERVLDEVQNNPDVCGALIWSLRFRARDGGFYWHSEPGLGGYFYKAYHVPGFESGAAYDERNVLNLYRQRAYAIRGMEEPPIPAPKPPVLLPCADVSRLNWQGSVFAECYDIERAAAAGGPWRAIAREITDANTAHRPLYNDRDVVIGQSYFYRLRARNWAGVSDPSNVIGPIPVTHHTLVDEYENFGQLTAKNDQVSIETDNTRAFKEDGHRLKGIDGGQILYYTPGPMASAMLWLFSADNSRRIELAVSTDGSQYQVLQPEQKDYYFGAGDYNYVWPISLILKSLPAGTRYLRIRFLGEAQLSRMEIIYGD